MQMKKWVALAASLLVMAGLLAGCSKGNADTVASGQGGVEYDPILGGWDASDTYINERFGITFNLPEGWEFLAPKEVAELQTSSSVDGSQYALYAQNAEATSRVVVTLTNLTEAGMDPNTPVEDFVSQVREATQTAQHTTVSEAHNYTLGSTEYLSITMENTEPPVAKGRLLYRVFDGYLVSVQIITVDGADEIDTLAGYFA